MPSDPDPETIRLCREHCTRAGMLFQDASALAVLVGALQPHDLAARVEELKRMTKQASVLLEAAGEIIRN